MPATQYVRVRDSVDPQYCEFGFEIGLKAEWHKLTCTIVPVRLELVGP